MKFYFKVALVVISLFGQNLVFGYEVSSVLPKFELDLNPDKHAVYINNLPIHTTMGEIKKLAQGASLAALAFQTEKVCIKPHKAPPDNLLKRKYKDEQVGNLASQSYEDIDQYIHKIDVTGDGICDWLREGAQPLRRDFGWANSTEFLFIGTSKGWRFTAQTPKGKALQKESKTNRQSPLYSIVGFAGFYAPLVAFVYEKGNFKPFIVVQALDDNDSTTLANYKTFRWNDEIDNLEQVPLAQHAAVMVFLQKEFCGKDPSKVIPNRDVSRFSEPSYNDTSLCKKPDISTKK